MVKIYKNQNTEPHLNRVLDFAKSKGLFVTRKITGASTKSFVLKHPSGHELKIETDLANDFPLLYLQGKYIFGTDKPYSEKDWNWFEKNSKSIILAVLRDGYKEIQWYKGGKQSGGTAVITDRGGKKIKLNDWSGPNFSLFDKKKTVNHPPLDS